MTFINQETNFFKLKAKKKQPKYNNYKHKTAYIHKTASQAPDK